MSNKEDVAKDKPAAEHDGGAQASEVTNVEPANNGSSADELKDKVAEASDVDRTDAQDADAEVETLPSYEEVTATLTQVQQQVDDYKDQLLRASAEMENLRRRTERDLANAHKFGLDKIAGELLPVKDSLEMGLAAASNDGADVKSVSEGIDLTLKMFAGVMEKFNIVELNPENERFNPEFHQAMSVQEVAGVEPNTVITVYQKGYTLNGRLLRPAMVVVSKAASGDDETPNGKKIDEMA